MSHLKGVYQYDRYGSIADPIPTDIFGRGKTGLPRTLFDSKLLFDNAPLIWDDSEESGGGTSSTHSVNRASVTLSVSANTAGKRTRQTFERPNYQPGKSQLIKMTGILDKSGGGAGIKRRLGLFDDNNGLFFFDDEGTFKVAIRSYVTGSAVERTWSRSNWDDPLDGSGPSGADIDFSKTQIFLINFAWLGVGGVRFGIQKGNTIIWFHTVSNENVLDSVYMSTPNLPLRYQIENDGTGVASSLEQICCTVISEGGIQPVGYTFSTGTTTHVDANDAGTLYAIVGIRKKSANIGANVEPVAFSMINTASDDYEWRLLMNPTVAGTFTYSSITNSSVEAAYGATANEVTGGTVVASGFVKGGSQSGDISKEVYDVLKLGSAIDETRDYLVLACNPLTNGANVHGSLTWRETM